jgi:hypothetical protein
VNHLPIAKTTYIEKAASKFQISPLDDAQYESILANNIQVQQRRRKIRRRKHHSPTPKKKNTLTHIHAKSVKNAKT